MYKEMTREAFLSLGWGGDLGPLTVYNLINTACQTTIGSEELCVLFFNFYL
jgi:hypothetical protein